MPTVIDFNTRKQETTSTLAPVASKELAPVNTEDNLSSKEILTNIITMLSEEVDNIEELVVAFSTKKDNFRAHSNIDNVANILLLLKQAEYGVMGVYTEYE